jgi:hypothetical protein
MRTVIRWGEQDHQSWTFVTPISNLVLGDAVDREIRINKVLFVDRDKLPYIRRRIGFHSRVSKIDSRKGDSNFFKLARAYAVIRYTGAPTEVENACLKIIRDELAILNLSYLGYAKRKKVSFPAMRGEHSLPLLKFVLLNAKDSSGVGVAKSSRHPNGLFLDGRWAKSQSARTFHGLVAILSKSIQVHPQWRRDLQRAAILVGESLETRDRAMSFLKNMIALESLLTRRGDKISDTLPTRAMAFLGWVDYWNTENYEQKIDEIYRKRNTLVHAGDKESIQPEDLVFTDDLLFNLITNLVTFPDLFGSKEKIIAFSKRVEMQVETVDQDQEVRPLGLRFSRPVYQPKDLENL